MKRCRGPLFASVRVGLAILCSVLILGCAPTDTMRIDVSARTPAETQPPTVESGPGSPADLAKLENLWTERQATNSQNEDYPIGPGDVLTLSVPDVEQLAQRRVRVSTRGTIELPLIGVIQAGGLSEDGLAAEIDEKLQKYMYKPQATVFVDEYRNREVAVIGALNRPGLVLLNSPSESLLDVLTQAGGISGAASDEVVLIPSRPGTVSTSQRLASVLNHPLPENGPSTNDLTDSEAGSADPGGEKVADAGAATTAWGGAQHGSHYPEGASDVPGESYSRSGSADAPGAAPSAAAAQRTGLGTASLSGHDDSQFAAAIANGARGAIRLNRFVGTVREPPSDRHRDVTDEATENADEAGQLAGNGEPITIKLKGPTLAGVGKYINMPMRPGDVLIVPGGGDVMVVGWVQQPGRFQAGSGLTVLGAIGAAGGPMYAANTKNIALIRTGKHGWKVTIPINMDKITHGEAPDLPVQANDVIDVPYSGMRIGPYIFYSILTKMGIGGPIIPY